MINIVDLLAISQRAGRRVLPIVAIAAALAAPGRAPAGVAQTPYIDTFEEYPNATPLVDGTNGWYGSSGEIIVTNIVHTNAGLVSTNLAMIPRDCTLSNRCDSMNTTGVWMQVDLNLAFYRKTSPPVVDTNIATIFYIDGDGYFVVHNGPPSPTPENSTNWMTLTTNAAGEAIAPLPADASVRVNLRQSYASQTWALFADGVLLAEGIGFIDTSMTNFSGFEIYNGNTTSLLDNVYISDWPVIEAAPTNISRTIWQGQDAGSNLVEVWNGNGTIPLVISNAVSYGPSCGDSTNWLSVTPVLATNYGAAQKSALWVRLDTADLLPQTNAYEATIELAGEPGAGIAPKTIPVAVSVQGAALWVGPLNLAKTASAGQGSLYDIIQVANTGMAPRATLSYTLTAASGPPEWLSVSPSSGWAIDNTNSATVTYSTAGLAAGIYTGTLEVVALAWSTQTVGVTFRVNSQPEAAWDAADKVWTNGIIAGSNLAPVAVNVWNASGQPQGSMRYEIYVDNNPFNWVSANPPTGIITGQQDQVAVSYSTAGLAPGEYTARLVLEGWDEATDEPATNGPLFVWLKLTVQLTEAPVLKVSPASLNPTVPENGAVTNSFQIWNGGGLPHGGMLYTVSPGAGWFSVNPGSGAVTDETDSIAVVFDAGTLLPGTYTGSIVVAAQDANSGTAAAGSPTNIALVMTVAPGTPQNLELPAVIGALFVGQTVSAYTGLWNRWQNQGLTFSYQWIRAATPSGSGQEILSGQTSSNYVVTAADRGKYLRVRVTAADTANPALRATAESPFSNAMRVNALTADWNGDGITDLWFYDQPSGMWHINFGSQSSTSGIWPGLGPNMDAVPGDYDGNGHEDLAVYDRANGMWYVLLLPSGAVVDGSLMGGTVYENEATPVPADYDGDGATDPAFYWEGYWVVLYTHDLWKHAYLGYVEPFAQGLPVRGDWDGNGTTDMGVYANGIWQLRLGDGTVLEQVFGGRESNVLPAPGDYDGDGITDLGVHDCILNEWQWKSSQTGASMRASFGWSGGWPMPGYYDHDRKADFAHVFMHANNYYIWLVKRTAESASYPYLYHGQSFELNTGIWRVSW